MESLNESQGWRRRIATKNTRRREKGNQRAGKEATDGTQMKHRLGQGGKGKGGERVGLLRICNSAMDKAIIGANLHRDEHRELHHAPLFYADVGCFAC